MSVQRGKRSLQNLSPTNMEAQSPLMVALGVYMQQKCEKRAQSLHINAQMK